MIDNAVHETDVDVTETEEAPEWLDVLGNGVLQKKILIQGQGIDTRPNPSQKVRISASVTIDGVLESSEAEYIFRLTEGDVFAGFPTKLV